MQVAAALGSVGPLLVPHEMRIEQRAGIKPLRDITRRWLSLEGKADFKQDFLNVCRVLELPLSRAPIA